MTTEEKLALAQAQLAALEEEFREYNVRWLPARERWYWRGVQYTWDELLRAVVEARN